MAVTSAEVLKAEALKLNNEIIPQFFTFQFST
jgi:hypothetical protein